MAGPLPNLVSSYLTMQAGIDDINGAPMIRQINQADFGTLFFHKVMKVCRLVVKTV